MRQSLTAGRRVRVVARSAVTALLCLGVVSCGTGPNPTIRSSLIVVPTQDPAPSDSPRPCPAALVEGDLVADPRWGLVLADVDGLTRKVVWPHGFAARQDGSRLALLDAGGSVVAHEGDRIRIGGGETGDDAAWLACGGISLLSVSGGSSP
jgi:hypothetical protein